MPPPVITPEIARHVLALDAAGARIPEITQYIRDASGQDYREGTTAVWLSRNRGKQKLEVTRREALEAIKAIPAGVEHPLALHEPTTQATALDHAYAVAEELATLSADCRARANVDALKPGPRRDLFALAAEIATQRFTIARELAQLELAAARAKPGPAVAVTPKVDG